MAAPPERAQGRSVRRPAPSARPARAITIHPGRDQSAPFEILEILADAGADVGRVVMGHIERTELDRATPPASRRDRLLRRVRLVRRGALDVPDRARSTSRATPSGSTRSGSLIDEGHLDQVLASHDVCLKTRLARYGARRLCPHPGQRHGLDGAPRGCRRPRSTGSSSRTRRGCWRSRERRAGAPGARPPSTSAAAQASPTSDPTPASRSSRRSPAATGRAISSSRRSASGRSPSPSSSGGATRRPGSRPGPRPSCGPILRRCREAGIRIVANFGAANSLGAGRLVLVARRRARPAGLQGRHRRGRRPADLRRSEAEIRSWTIIEGIPVRDEPIIAANVYLGAAPVAEALRRGADVVDPRAQCADSALVLGPLVHEFGWADDDWERLAAGTLAGHLLECSAQLSGGYFADPGYKDVPGLARVGFPIAEVGADGSMVVTKADDTGGLVSARTVKEQILYEIARPVGLPRPGRHARHHRRRGRGGRPNRVRVQRRARQAPTADAQGHDQHRGRLARRGRDLVRRAERARPRRARGSRPRGAARARSARRARRGSM